MNEGAWARSVVPICLIIKITWRAFQKCKLGEKEPGRRERIPVGENGGYKSPEVGKGMTNSMPFQTASVLTGVRSFQLWQWSCWSSYQRFKKKQRHKKKKNRHFWDDWYHVLWNVYLLQQKQLIYISFSC